MVFAGVGVVMALPASFQMVWGRPKLLPEFENGAEGSNRFLIVYLKNPPVKGWLSGMLGVRREALQSLTAQFQVAEVGSGRIAIPIRQAQIYSDADETDKGRARTALPPTFSVAASIMVVNWHAGNGRAVVTPSRTAPETALPEGHYEARFVFLADGAPLKFTRRFVVGHGPDDLRWQN